MPQADEVESIHPTRRQLLRATVAGGTCAAIAAALLAVPSTAAGRSSHDPVEWHEEFQSSDSADILELIIPVYEGLRITNPFISLPEAGFANLELAYPGPLSAPFAAWRFGEGQWTAIFADSLTALPVSLHVTTGKKTVSLTLKSWSGAKIQSLQVRGSWQDVSASLRAQWNDLKQKVKLADKFDRVNFYVHQWIADDDPPLRTDWTVDELATEMKGLESATLVQLYGMDPGGMDLGARYFWADGAEAKSRKIIAANPKISHLSWLNLRTYKTSIPRMRRELPVTATVRDMAREDRAGVMTEHGAFDAVDMRLACKAWQTSRLKEFDHLIDVGFRVIQLDEFPIPPVWHISPCMASGHLHAPGDAVEEWALVVKFIKQLSRRADAAGVMLTCEEPSAALLPYVSGYVDRQFNDKIDLYKAWRKSTAIQTIPLFSTMFDDVCTPYTDTDEVEPARQPPKHWLKAGKIYPARMR